MECSATSETWCPSFLGQGRQIKSDVLEVAWEVFWVQLVKGEHERLLSRRLTWLLFLRSWNFIVYVCKAHFPIMNIFFNVERLTFLMLIYFDQYRMELYHFSGLELWDRNLPPSHTPHPRFPILVFTKNDINDLNVSWIIYIRGNDTMW